jgi:hypothetical protein
MISMPTVCLAQTVLLSCKDTNNISKQNKTRFHMTQVTLGYHRVRPKWFLRMWYVRHKLCTYLASRLALSLNGLNWASLEPNHLGVPPVASITISEPMVYLTQTMHLSCTDTTLSPNGPKWDSTWPTSPRSSIGCVQNNFKACGTFGANWAPILRQH